MQLKQKKVEDLVAWNIKIQTLRLAKRKLETWLGESQRSCCECTVLSIKDAKPFSTQLCRPGESTRGHTNKQQLSALKPRRRTAAHITRGQFVGWVCSRKLSSRIKIGPHCLVPALQLKLMCGRKWEKIQKVLVKGGIMGELSNAPSTEDSKTTQKLGKVNMGTAKSWDFHE